MDKQNTIDFWLGFAWTLYLVNVGGWIGYFIWRALA
jgi:hypothetical protein